MAVKLTCDIDSPEEIFELVAELKSRCKFETLKHAKAMIESGAAASFRDAAEKIAESSGDKVSAVRSRIGRAKKSLDACASTKSKAEKVGTPVPTDGRTPLERARDQFNEELFKTLDDLRADKSSHVEMIKQPDGTHISKHDEIKNLLAEMLENIAGVLEVEF